MTAFLTALCAALIVSLAIVRTARSGSRTRACLAETSGPQDFHVRTASRLGGLAIGLGVCFGLALGWNELGSRDRTLSLALLGCALFVLAVGIVEDITQRVSPSMRLLAITLAAAVAAWLLDARIDQTGLTWLDYLFEISAISMGLTLLAVSGVANSINIIDGFNGLASMCAAFILGAIAYVAMQVGDMLVLTLAVAALGAIFGFFMWNYPFGLVFLGDGGAYFLGFWIAELGILLFQRNEAVSPLFPLLLCSYPVFETLFSMYRRKVIRGRPVGQPDAGHLHSLIYRRLMRWAVGRSDPTSQIRRNSMTSPYLWFICSLSVIPAVLCWDDTELLGVCIVGFCTIYVALYRSIVRFRTPRLLIRKATRWEDVRADTESAR